MKACVPESKFELGAPGWKKLPLLQGLCKARNGKPGLDAKFFLDPSTTTRRRLVEELYVGNSYMYLSDYKHLN